MKKVDCPAIGDNAGWKKYYRHQWELLAADPAAPAWLRSYAKDCAAAYSLSNRWSAPVHVRLQAYAEREFWKGTRA